MIPLYHQPVTSAGPYEDLCFPSQCGSPLERFSFLASMLKSPDLLPLFISLERHHSDLIYIASCVEVVKSPTVHKWSLMDSCGVFDTAAS